MIGRVLYDEKGNLIVLYLEPKYDSPKARNVTSKWITHYEHRMFEFDIDELENELVVFELINGKVVLI